MNEHVTLKYLKGILDEKTFNLLKNHKKRDSIFKEIDKELKVGELSDNNISMIIDKILKKLKLKLNESLVTCSGCGAKVEQTFEDPYLCESCSLMGWWIDPAGGVHGPTNDDDFEDPTGMYENKS